MIENPRVDFARRFICNTMYYMKHTANRSKATGKAKTKTLTQAKAISKTTPAAKISNVKSASKPAKKIAVQKSKPAVKTAIKKAAPKLSAKTLDALETLSVRKTNAVAKKFEKPTAKKPAPKTVGEAGKTAQKSKPAVAKKPRKIVAAVKTKQKPAKLKAVVKPIAKTKVKTVKSTAKKPLIQTSQPRRTKVEKSAPIKPKTNRRLAQTVVAPKQAKAVGKVKPIVGISAKKVRKIVEPIVKKVERKKLAAPITTVKTTRKNAKPKSANREKISAKPEKNKLTAATTKNVVERTRKLKPTLSIRKTEKSAPKIKTPAPTKKITRVEKPLEAIAETIPAKPKNRKARPISSAVFRGVKERYAFKVFALNEKLEAIPAVYIISKRKIDRRKKGHHQLVCIGQTDSIADELRRHRKGKCVKKHQANAVSILPETDRQTRLKIETDLKAAHAVACKPE